MKYNFKNITNCPLCSFDKNRVWDKNNNNEIVALDCNKCKLVFMNKILSDEDLKDFYNKYNSDRDLLNNDKKSQRFAMYKFDYESIISIVPENGTFLDIGCGRGDFLDHFIKVKKIGFEIDHNAVNSGLSLYPQIHFISSLNEISNDNN